ncbi:hypothetical protein PILCRDRAFT_823592 [Piloderma croceum F 1598]|uniref:Uncharacterized protein n=1 Tax=Piloderma croceum (strain F 1598) TaxID=765440 RepID=A0A0C3F3J3_PILCF|nr:hypothetical protein PILCRDRAFT_823592 [Piloderma croceum F 1598]
MDAFSIINFFTKASDVIFEPSTNEETGSGGSGNGYGAVTREVVDQTPVNEETGGTTGAFCVVV